MSPRPEFPPFRVGLGNDIHPFVEARPLILGGINIPHTQGLGGHSDADALCHAITDALLGAMGMGDIGHHFPDTEARYQNADSTQLLQEVWGKIRAQGWDLGNLDATLITEKPKLAPHIPALVDSLAGLLGVKSSRVNVKAKTHEKMDAIGQGLALSAHVVVLLYAQETAH